MLLTQKTVRKKEQRKLRWHFRRGRCKESVNLSRLRCTVRYFICKGYIAFAEIDFSRSIESDFLEQFSRLSTFALHMSITYLSKYFFVANHLKLTGYIFMYHVKNFLLKK